MKPLISLTALLLLGAAALPQPSPQAQPQEDPPDAAEHGVARLSLLSGSITVTRGDSGESIAAIVNEPLVTADRVFTGEGSRSEVQFDSANIIRLGADTDVRLGDLQYHRYLVQINRGTAMFRVLRDSDSHVEISTPSVSVSPLGQGTYRVTVRPDGSSEITVREGEAELISPAGTERLSAGKTMLSRGSANDPEFLSTRELAYDEWDRWNADRDRFYERASDVSRYAGPDIEGTQELANYGHWVWDPAYGSVWVPDSVPPEWAPYRDGRWDYLDYYGWSWTSYDPWGWAPYHYGNWYRSSFGWAWYPGASGPRHYWRPAMVGFFGFGSPGFGVSLGFGYGNVGWVPLAPHERFRPWYGRGTEFGRGNEYGRGFAGGRNEQIVNNANIAAVYRNARFSGAVTGLRVGDFGRVAVQRNSFVRPEAGDLARGGVVNGGMPFAPARNYSAASAARFSSPAGRFNRSTNSGGNNNVIRLNSAPADGGWRRLNSQPGSPPLGANRTDVHIYPSQRPAPEPVRISPAIVNNRFEAPSNFRGGAPDSFGGSRQTGGPGFGAPPAQAAPAYAAPRGNPDVYRAPQNRGGYSGAPQGGGYRGSTQVGGAYRSAPPSGGGYGSAPQSGDRYRSAPPSGGGAPRGNSGGGPRGGGGEGRASGGGHGH